MVKHWGDEILIGRLYSNINRIPSDTHYMKWWHWACEHTIGSLEVVDWQQICMSIWISIIWPLIIWVFLPHLPLSNVYFCKVIISCLLLATPSLHPQSKLFCALDHGWVGLDNNDRGRQRGEMTALSIQIILPPWGWCITLMHHSFRRCWGVSVPC